MVTEQPVVAVVESSELISGLKRVISLPGVPTGVKTDAREKIKIIKASLNGEPFPVPGSHEFFQLGATKAKDIIGQYLPKKEDAQEATSGKLEISEAETLVTLKEAKRYLASLTGVIGKGELEDRLLANAAWCCDSLQKVIARARKGNEMVIMAKYEMAEIAEILSAAVSTEEEPAAT